MKKRKWFYPIIGVALVVVIGIAFYLFNQEDGLIIPDEDPPLGGYFLNKDTRLAITSLGELEAASKKTLKTKDLIEINNSAMAIARVLRYGHLKPGLEKILWNNYAGPLPEAYKTYFATADPKTDELLVLVSKLGNIIDPVTGGDIDFVHMIAVIDVYYTNYTENPDLERYYDYLMSWGGDLDTFAINLNQYVTKNKLTSYEDIYDYAYKLLASGELKSYFSEEDFYADLDGVNIANMMIEEELLLSEAIERYYKMGIVKNRHNLFVDSFGGVERFKEVVHSYVTLEVEPAFADDKEFIDFMKGFGSFKSMMLMVMGQDAENISDAEIKALEAAFVDHVLEGKAAEDLAAKLALAKEEEKKKNQ